MGINQHLGAEREVRSKGEFRVRIRVEPCDRTGVGKTFQRAVTPPPFCTRSRAGSETPSTHSASLTASSVKDG
ncbi:hypothetical protein [Streptomyces scopuliridis]|uniref:hypothetical protein n=1 Tax=Streptomyces scopuliridis TaxID=452529 RepID=UPI00369A401F